MGIDFDPGTAHWSYIGFNRFREILAKEINVDLKSMQGFNGQNSWDTVKDNIKPLLDHSDCDGELTVKECKMVAPRLKQLIKKWPESYDKIQAHKLINDMLNCVEKKVPLTFC